MQQQLTRTMFETSRAVEYFNARELAAQTGQPIERFASVAIKELLDNAIDACETAGVQPHIDLRWRWIDGAIEITVTDNAGGITPETVRRILNFTTRTSDKAAYRAPTRGAQGNALKTIIGMPHALGGDAPIVIASQGVVHTIRAWIDPAGELRIDHDEQDGDGKGGTSITVTLPTARQLVSPLHWALAFVLCNPHASVKIQAIDDRSERANSGSGTFEDSYQASVGFPGDWRKHLPTDGTSPHWYDLDAFKRLVFAHIGDARRGGKDANLRDFVREFRGLSGTAKAKQVCGQLPWITRLSDFERQIGDLGLLLSAMQDAATPPSSAVLGCIGEDHLRARIDSVYGVKRWWYKRVSGDVNGVPFVFEAALAHTHEENGDFWPMVNFSPTFTDPTEHTSLESPNFNAYGVKAFLSQSHASPRTYYGPQPFVSMIHLICPSLEWLDRGKTRLNVPGELAKAIGQALWQVTKDIYKEEEARQRDTERAQRRERERERQEQRQEKQREWTLKEAVFRVLQEAYDHGTGGGIYPLSVKDLHYGVRPLIQQYTGKELDLNYFSQTLVPLYRKEVAPMPNLFYFPRGILYEPHTGVEIPLGTREVENYVFPAWLYDKILYIEKRGVAEALKVVKLGDRYDMAIVAAEGYATEACRVLFAHADKQKKYTIFVMHDADPYGYNIARTLREETGRMPGYSVDVIDIGLKLEAALESGLQTEVFVRKNALPKELVLSDAERKYFEGKQVSFGKKPSWECQRIEINAMPVPDRIKLIEQKLQEHGVTQKVIPDADALPDLASDIYDDAIGAYVDRYLDQLLDIDAIREAVREKLTSAVPLDDARAWIDEAIAEDDAIAWRDAVRRRLDCVISQEKKTAQKIVNDHVFDRINDVSE